MTDGHNCAYIAPELQPDPPGEGNGNGGGAGNGHEANGAFAVRLEVFEGPLDLLLYLIKRDELDITDIPIARITDEYLKFIRLMETLDLEVAGEFVLMAATLIRIKSSMLLPRDEEAEDEEDPREELVRALLEYRKYKEAAQGLRQREEAERAVWARSDFSDNKPVMRRQFVMDHTLYDLLAAFKSVLERVEVDTFHQVEYPEKSVPERIVELEELLEHRETVSFTEMFQGLAARWLVVLTMLAILEMVRLQRLTIEQSTAFGEIVLCRTTMTGTPLAADDLAQPRGSDTGV